MWLNQVSEKVGQDQIDRAPDWSYLGLVGKSLPVRSTALIPVIGYLILFNEFVATQLSASIFVEIAGDAQPESLSSTLFLIYFGLFFLGIGSMLFTTRCPKTLKSNASVHSYVESEKSLLSPYRCRELLKESTERYAQKAIQASTKQPALSADHSKKLSEIELSEVLTEFWSLEDQSALH